MVERMKPEIAKKCLLRGTVHFILAGFLLTAAVRPANAQVVFDPTMYATQLLQKIQSGWADAVHSLGQFIQGQVNIKLADSQRNADRTNVDVAAAQANGLRYAFPSTHSSCAIAQGARAQADHDIGSGAEHQALSTGGANLKADPAADAKNLSAQLKSGLRPCTGATSGGQADDELSFNKAAGCTDQFNGQYARADTVMSSLAGDAPYEFPVPPTFQLPLNGISQPIQPVTDAKYMPFTAAFSYCQNVSPRIPKAYQAINNQLTADAMGMTNFVHVETIASTAYDTCIDLLVERMQHTVGSSNAAYAAMHTDEATKCTADFKRGIIDSTANDTCQTDGRSKLQAMYDWANRPQATSYHNVYINNNDFAVPDAGKDEAMAASDMQEFTKLIKEERQELISAIAVSMNAVPPGFSPLSAPVATSSLEDNKNNSDRKPVAAPATRPARTGMQQVAAPLTEY